MTIASVAAGAPRLTRGFRWPWSRRYLVSRLLNAVLTVWAVLTIVFFALHLTGNPAVVLVAPDAPKETLAQITNLMGFDKPILEQYGIFLRQIVTGHYPDSIRYGESPLHLVAHRLPATLELGAVGLCGAIILGSLAGYVAATSGHRRLRRIPVSVLTSFEAIPSFFLSVVLIALFAITWPILPFAGNDSPDSIVLPALVITCSLAAPISRVFRTSLQETLDADHVRLAQAKGISPRAVMFRHVVVNSLAPVINVIGVQAGVVLGGAVVTETVFSWPGVGQLTTAAIGNRDYPIVLASVTVLAIGFVVINLVVDLVAAGLDPRGGQR